VLAACASHRGAPDHRPAQRSGIVVDGCRVPVAGRVVAWTDPCHFLLDLDGTIYPTIPCLAQKGLIRGDRARRLRHACRTTPS
jgi:hypothetical protein